MAYLFAIDYPPNTVLSNICESLLRINPDLTISPGLAESFENPDPTHLKTLILDLDETLIHSMSRGGRIGSGHMVEVRLNTTYVGAGGQQSLGPQHPILYYVHKRPHCDEFLRKVSPCFPGRMGMAAGRP